MDRIDLSSELRPLIGRLGVPYESVRSVHCEATQVTVVVLAVDANGKKYIDEETGDAAVEVRVFDTLS